MNGIVYTPTGERVTILRIANRGQQRPGEPGSGIRLYAVRFPDGSAGQASAGELAVYENGKRRAFRSHSTHIPADY